MRDTTKFVSQDFDLYSSTYPFSKFASNLKINELSFENVSLIGWTRRSVDPTRQ